MDTVVRRGLPRGVPEHRPSHGSAISAVDEGAERVPIRVQREVAAREQIRRVALQSDEQIFDASPARGSAHRRSGRRWAAQQHFVCPLPFVTRQMRPAPALQIAMNEIEEGGRDRHGPVFVAFTPYLDRASLEVDVADAQSSELDPSQAHAFGEREGQFVEQRVASTSREATEQRCFFESERATAGLRTCRRAETERNVRRRVSLVAQVRPQVPEGADCVLFGRAPSSSTIVGTMSGDDMSSDEIGQVTGGQRAWRTVTVFDHQAPRPRAIHRACAGRHQRESARLVEIDCVGDGDGRRPRCTGGGGHCVGAKSEEVEQLTDRARLDTPGSSEHVEREGGFVERGDGPAGADLFDHADDIEECSTELAKALQFRSNAFAEVEETQNRSR